MADNRKDTKKSTRKEILKDFEDLALKAGVKIRYEKTTAKGGMCEFQGAKIIIIDRKATDEYKISVIAENIKKIDLSNVYIEPKLRDVLDNY